MTDHRSARLGIVLRPTAVLFLCLIVFAACGDVESRQRTTGSPWRAPIDIVEMVENADAVVLGRIASEADISIGLAMGPGGWLGAAAEPTRYRNFVVQVRESYVPGVEQADTIMVRVAPNTRTIRIAAATMDVEELPDFEPGAELLLFLERIDRYEQRRLQALPPDGHPPDAYYRLPSPDGDLDGTIATGYLTPQDDRLVYPGTESGTTKRRFDDAVRDHASLVRTECFGFEAMAAYVPVSPLGSLVAGTDVVFKARTGGLDTAIGYGTVTFEVLEVLVGDLPGTTITLKQAYWTYTPGFEAFDYYVFLRDVGGAFADEQGPFYNVAGGTQGIFVAENGIVQQEHIWPLSRPYRGMGQGEFEDAVTSAADWVRN